MVQETDGSWKRDFASVLFIMARHEERKWRMEERREVRRRRKGGSQTHTHSKAGHNLSWTGSKPDHPSVSYSYSELLFP